MNTSWSGRPVEKARTYWAARIAEAQEKATPLLCLRCPHPVLVGQPFDIDHVIPRSESGSALPLAP